MMKIHAIFMIHATEYNIINSNTVGSYSVLSHIRCLFCLNESWCISALCVIPLARSEHSNHTQVETTLTSDGLKVVLVQFDYSEKTILLWNDPTAESKHGASFCLLKCAESQTEPKDRTEMLQKCHVFLIFEPTNKRRK